MAGKDGVVKSAKVHRSGSNRQILKAIEETSVKTSAGEAPHSTRSQMRKLHHNKGKVWGRPFQKGHDAYSHNQKNPISLLDLLKSELGRVPTKDVDGFDGKGKTNAWWLIHEYVMEARGLANITAIKDILDRLEGKPAQAITGAGGGPIELNQNIKVIEEKDVQGAISALVECGAMNFNPN